MNICSCTQTNNAYQANQTNAKNGFRQTMQDFRGLADALQQGDISGAQSVFTTLQSDLQNSQSNASGTPSPLLDTNTAVGKDFQALQSAIQSGDLKSAKDAFATLRQDLRNAMHAHGHNHHHVDNDGDTDDTNSTSQSDTSIPTNTDPTQDTALTLNVTA